VIARSKDQDSLELGNETIDMKKTTARNLSSSSTVSYSGFSGSF